MVGARQTAAQRARQTAKDIGTRAFTRLHRVIYRASGGRFLNRGFGMPVVILTTTGRRSGKRRDTMLTAPVHDGDRLVLVASNGGDDRHPAWFLNLRDHPDVEITLDGRTRAARARMASPDEKTELWPRVIASYRGYDGYQQRTDRDIPLVIVE